MNLKIESSSKRYMIFGSSNQNRKNAETEVHVIHKTMNTWNIYPRKFLKRG